MKRRLFLMLGLSVLLPAVAGCRTTRDSCAPVSYFPPYVGPTPGLAPCDRCRQSAYPPGRIVPVPVTAPPAPTSSAFPSAPVPDGVASAGVVQRGSFSSSTLVDPFGRSLLDPGVHLTAPLPNGPDSVHLSAPLPQGSPASSSPPPTVGDGRGASPPLPVDVPQFAVAKDRVASGLQPFPDGVAWLQAHHYRTVLYLRAPGEDDSAARLQFEKRGLRYLSLEVAPNTLSKDVVDRFDRMVTDESNLPLYVYDNNEGAHAGGLWYLYFRTVEGATDERARTEAVRLGIQPDRDGEHRSMWIAVQNYLRNLNP